MLTVCKQMVCDELKKAIGCGRLMLDLLRVMMALVQMLAYKDLDNAVSNSSIPVIVAFGTSRCPPCRELAPVYQKIAEYFENNVVFFTLNVDKNPEAVLRFHIQSIPTALLFRNGKETKRANDGVAIINMLEELALELYKQAHYH